MKRSLILFSGGLGNQLFQYAFFLAKQRAGDRSLAYNTYSICREGLANGFELPRLFGLSGSDEAEDTGLVRWVRKLLIFQRRQGLAVLCRCLLRATEWLAGIRVVKESDYSTFHPEYLNEPSRPTLYFGFWQTACYFDAFEERIRQLYTFDERLVGQRNKDLLTSLQGKETVSIHIRRGDFYTQANENLYGGIASPTYYERSIAYLETQVKHPVYLVFSDDPQWAKAHLPLPEAIVVDWNQGQDSWQDMYLMTQCRHNIIANSTFSWWGAWLNACPNKVVVAPKRFLNCFETPDIYPDDWTLIDSE